MEGEITIERLEKSTVCILLFVVVACFTAIFLNTHLSVIVLSLLLFQKLIFTRFLLLRKAHNQKSPFHKTFSSLLSRVQEEKRRIRDRERGRSATSCPYYNSDGLDNLRDKLAVELMDIEQLVDSGKTLKACPYYGTRRSVPFAQVRKC